MPDKTNKVLIYVIAIISALLFGALVYYCVSYQRQRKEFEERTQKALSTESVEITPDNILGNYSVKLEACGDIEYTTGYIENDILGSYVLHILSLYEPHVFILEFDSEGRIYARDLGVGSMTYKASIDKTMIRFEKDGLKCTLTK